MKKITNKSEVHFQLEKPMEGFDIVCNVEKLIEFLQDVSKTTAFISIDFMNIEEDSFWLKCNVFNLQDITPKDVKVIAETLGGQTIPPNERLVEAGARYLKELKD